MIDFKRGMKLEKHLTKEQKTKIDAFQIFYSVFEKEYPCQSSCSNCCISCHRLKLCYESWINRIIRRCPSSRRKQKYLWCDKIFKVIGKKLEKK